MDGFRLFFSNRSVDQSRVDDLQSRLRGLLPNLPFVDVSRDVPFIDDWRTPAKVVLESSDALICVVGPDTYASEPVDWEIREGFRLGKPIVVARVSEAYRLPPCCDELRIAATLWDAAQLSGHIGELLVSRVLFLRHDWSAGGPDPSTVWNQYNLMVQSWESLISRRQTVNTLYLSSVAALLAGVGVLVSSIDKTGIPGTTGGGALLALLGAALCFNWRRTIVSYGVLSRAKSKVISALEAHMPAQLFDAEWRVLEAKQYRSTTDTDKQTALFFLLLFIAVGLISGGVALGRFW